MVSKLTLGTLSKLKQTLLVNFAGVIRITPEDLLVVLLVFAQLREVCMLVQPLDLFAVGIKAIIQQVSLGVQILKTLLNKS